MTGILAGLRIVEGSAFIAAPLGGMTLAQLGADVIRFDDIRGGLDSDRWPVTIRIGLITVLLSYALGTLLGFIAALRQNSWIDYLVTAVSTLGMTIPSWVVGTLFLVTVGTAAHARTAPRAPRNPFPASERGAGDGG